ncbi:LysR family transcriptional regulator [Actinoplanes lobatus]|uniref:DNA-binding transcriptional LysR family regulator n=1 Tax=Actinoplanes lobatus TaxID=113568 RepID=A0A7W7MHC5_9ACTN|nr:LysR family transcriptional regulator [Actinoplanes lobatus]MBB4749820.1 DNA-binding transcriptional LysR family regulator [Actinoplanes lobatus]GGN93234.1 LysR family transcriptional regulator [Actinoplanes lobatus]GIE38557.1 LysR family transcriptional regulator [Actinoplanes lobatus]
MELRHLRYFVATAEAGTVSGAAARLHLTQPGLSRQLRQLEKDLGVPLFDRAGSRLELSTTGRALLPQARDLLQRADALRVAASFHAQGRLERLTIGAPTVTLTDVVAPFIATLAPDDPTTDVLGADGLSPAETLRLGADLAIGTTPASPPFHQTSLAVLPVWAYVPAGHQWAGREAVTLAELLTQTLILLPKTFTARQALDAVMPGISAVEAANGTVAQALAAAGRGIAIASDDPRFGLTPLGVEANGRRLSIRLVAVWDSRHAAATTIGRFAARLGRFVRDRYDAPAA